MDLHVSEPVGGVGVLSILGPEFAQTRVTSP